MKRKGKEGEGRSCTLSEDTQILGWVQLLTGWAALRIVDKMVSLGTLITAWRIDWGRPRAGYGKIW